MSAGAIISDSDGNADSTEWPRLSWLAITALIANSVAGAIGFLGVGIVLPLIANHFASTPGAGLLAQLLGGIVGAALAVSSPLAGWLIDRIGYRAVYLYGAVFFAVFGAAPFFLNNLYLILACRVGVGVSMAAVLIGGYAGISTLAPPLRAKLMGYNAVIGGLAAVALFLILGLLGKIGWRYAFLPHLGTLLLIPLILTLPRQRRKRVAVSKDQGKGLGVPLGLLAISVLGGMLCFVGSNFSAFYLASIGVTDPSRMAIPLMLMSACAVAGCAIFGPLHVRAGGTRVFAIALTLVGIGFILMSHSHSLLLFAIGGGIGGFGSAFIAPNLSVTAMEVAEPARIGHVVGLVTGAMFAAQLIVPFITEPLRQITGPASVFFSFGAAGLIVGLGYAVATLTRSGKRRLATQL
jgi:MFS family permease